MEEEKGGRGVGGLEAPIRGMGEVGESSDGLEGRGKIL